MVNPVKERADPKHTEPVDFAPFLKKLSDASKNDPEYAKVLGQSMIEAMNSSGVQMLMRAFDEELLTEQEWLNVKKKYGFEYDGELCAPLSAYFMKKDKHIPEDERTIILTTTNSPLHKAKKWAEAKFGIIIKNEKEFFAEMEALK